MAKVNKSAAIREALAEHPSASSKEIVALLAEKGVKVAPALVYYVKFREKHARQQSRKGAGKGRWDMARLIVGVKALAEKAGGIKNLKRLVDVLAE